MKIHLMVILDGETGEETPTEYAFLHERQAEDLCTQVNSTLAEVGSSHGFQKTNWLSYNTITLDCAKKPLGEGLIHELYKMCGPVLAPILRGSEGVHPDNLVEA